MEILDPWSRLEAAGENSVALVAKKSNVGTDDNRFVTYAQFIGMVEPGRVLTRNCAGSVETFICQQAIPHGGFDRYALHV